MNDGHRDSENIHDIAELYYENGWHTKAAAYDHLTAYPDSLCVNINPYPYLEKAKSGDGEKYVRSKPDYTGRDNLLNLPRE